MKNSCHNLEFLLSAFVNHDLAASSRENVVAHLANCAACRQKVEEYRAIKNHLSTVPTLVLPENLFADFQQGVIERITRQTPRQNQQLGIIAFLYVLYRRHRFLVSAVSLILLLAIPKWLTHQHRTPTARRLPLAQMLEKRDWTNLYYAMLDGDSQMRLLNEPVPVNLVHSAFNELMNAQRENPKLRAGLQQVLSKIKTPAGNSFRLSHSAQILGKISATGFEPATRSARIVWNPESVLLASAQIVAGQNITLRELFLPNLEGNKL